MLFLIEPPAKRALVTPVRSGQHLLDLAHMEEDGYDDDYGSGLNLSGWFQNWLIGKSNSADYSDRWKRDFTERPTWCDADMSLQQIKRGNARGNKAALYSRSFIQRCLYQLGCYVQKHSFRVIFLVLFLFSLCCYGLQFVHIETDIVKLWVSEGGRLHDELNYFSEVQERYGNQSWTAEDDARFIREPPDEKLFQRPEDEIGNTGYQVLIQTNDHPSENLLTEQGLLRHVQLLQEIVELQVEKYGINWTLADICFKPGGLDIENSSLFYSFKPVLERLVPCIWITPIDCFYEGSKPLGPTPPIDISGIRMFLQHLIGDLNDQVSWSNINPEVLIKGISEAFDIGTVKDFFLRTGIGAGYLERPCINPLDPTCPTLAPNYYNSCKAMEIYEQHLAVSGLTIGDVLTPEVEEKPDDDLFSGLANLFGFGGGSSSSKTSSDNEKTAANGTDSSEAKTKDESLEEKAQKCKKYRTSFLKWIEENKEKAKLLFGPHMPVYPDYGKTMQHGCQGFARTVLNWPTDMILGGISHKDDTFHAEALQSVLLVSTPTDVYKRLRGTPIVEQLKEATDDGEEVNATLKWSPNMAEEIISAWQRRFTDSIYNHEFNFKKDSEGGTIEKRIIHPLASTSISDMLAEFCDFNYMIIFVGYFLMLCYAIYSQMRFDGCCLLSANSAMGLACAGIFTVTFASIAGLGLSTWLGIEFNAATTQIVPFLTLGIGVDNMFLLLHNYPEITKNVKKNEIGVLMKETGMSILMTALNNILSFLAGTILPIPALRSFCTQSSILLTFNLIAILTVYPAIISLDLRRKKSGRRDICCCLVSEESVENPTYEKSYPYGFDLGPSAEILRDKQQYHGLISRGKEEDEEVDGVQPWTLRAFLRNYYVPFIKQPCTKFFVLVMCIGLFVAGIVGVQNSTQGLDLSDVLPENTAPSAFLKARDKYFSFYPMFVVLRGEDIDFAKQQHAIENLRRDIGKSRFVVKLENGEPSERYWLGLFKEWLIGLQQKLDEAQKLGQLKDFDLKHKNASNELKIAYSMVCSYGNTYDCSRVGRVRLIDESGTINPEGFYNYLYAWHEYESMFYRVSQANFYPKLHKLRQGKPEKFRYFIPPAPKPMYSQIPFYLTGLTDTTIIVEMIKEIRGISENYTNIGVDNYPNGVAFTFWEQYLDLNTNLFKAISMIAFAVFCVISLLLFNPWAASCIMVILLMMTVELAGFLGWCGIKLNPVSAVTLITAVGIGVEFTAHVVFAFLTSLGTRDERMEACIDRVFVPVIHGALSTLLGILMLGFSEFEFVQKYFFVVMSALIIIGLINGLILLPVLLSLIGPNCEIRPRKGINNLPVPPPLSRNPSKFRVELNHSTKSRTYKSLTPEKGKEMKNLITQPQVVFSKTVDHIDHTIAKSVSSFNKKPGAQELVEETEETNADVVV